ncbi:hypothetical protein MPTK1_8g06830 [Marchantia polymorpha subsp. ruderalis]|uniref:BTB domain-containing protein n=1 Tax=Marchantia polymorpha TaxID=3197 RepID=A0A2R6XIF2_MARPO|nr:hypothetical protein MARPO_0013s0109 [Marchantia polymorpha]BBN18961.1 hypothetical protein Mp_8g06830 [Marchantia polymorpha subsp. ruderalis]|eukprot:PTQ45885.1 hypothetical protein MARPO_0013s0109 [Marchantia polymorpha]
METRSLVGTERMDTKIISGSERKGHKRKLADTSLGLVAADGPNNHLILDVRNQIEVLKGCTSWREADRVAARRAAHSLAELAKHEEHVETIVDEGAVDALVPHLCAPLVEEGGGPISCEHEVEKDAAFALGLLAVKPEHQRLIADAGALPLLVSLLVRKVCASNARVVNGVVRRAADAITNLAHENANIKSRVRTEGGIPPLVELLESTDTKVQRAAAGALRTLAFKNEANKNQIVEKNALPTLIFMLRSEDVGIHYEAVGVIGNLVHSSVNIKKEVLNAGALQPVIGLLSSRCQESQREAALLLGQFATTDPECKVHIVQRGAVRPLIRMLEAQDPQLREMAAFALGRLAQSVQNTHNQAGIVHDGGLRPLLELLDSKNGSLQHNAAFALYGLADNEDNVSDIVKEGGVQRLQDGDLIVQASKDCVQKTLKRLEEKIHGRVLKHLLYLMRSNEKVVQRRVACTLAHLCTPDDQRSIFIEHNGMDVLLEMLLAFSLPKLQRDGALALHRLATKANNSSPLDTTPQPPTPQVYLGEQYVNNNTLSDVTFLVEGKRFYAHRIALLASSDAFRAMFDGGYRAVEGTLASKWRENGDNLGGTYGLLQTYCTEEKEAKDIEIPNISWKVFELMMRCIYTGAVEVLTDVAQDLLRAADQYLLEGLKRLCELTIAKDLTVENVANVYDLAEAYHAVSLRHTCVLFILEQHEQMCNLPGYQNLIARIIPEIRDYLHRILRPQDYVHRILRPRPHPCRSC